MTDTDNTEPKNTGRPELFTQDLADLVCARLAEGESMRSIARDDEMPGLTTLFKWLRTNDEFAKQYARAKEESADALFEEILDIADDARNDWMEKHGKDGEVQGYLLNGEHVQRSKLRADVRKWAVSKLKPKKYGDKLELSGDPDKPIQTVTRRIVDGPDDASK